MARMSILVFVLMSLLCSAGFAASLPGQDINAHVSVSYYTQSSVTAAASVDFVDSMNAPVQSSSEPTMAVIESSATPVTAGPATAFVAPDPGAQLVYTPVSSLFVGPSLVGKRVKVAGTLFTEQGMTYLDDGANAMVPDPAQPGAVVSMPVRVAIRRDLISSLPPDGSLVSVQGVIRIESDGEPSLLPFDNAAFVLAQH